MSNQDVLSYCLELLQGNSEIKHIQNRNIVSRAYYFTYYECVDHIQKRLGWGETNTKGGVHARAISRLLDQACTDPQKREDASILYTEINSLKKLRVRADYRLDLKITRATAEYCVKEAERIGISLSSL